ncbi:MAG: hypothetical protein ABIT38_22870 [Gemmatimonadaceae bacterium]
MTEASSENANDAPMPIGRHGCLTTYLVFVIIVNAALCLVYLFGSGALRRRGVSTPDWAFWALAICGVANVVSAIALLRWQRWGFWAFVASAIVGIAINLSIGLGPQGVVGALVGIAILYGVLHIGKERKAWPRLH